MIVKNNHTQHQLAFFLSSSLFKFLDSIILSKNVVILGLKSVDFLLPTLNFLKNSFFLQFKVLTDLTAVDYNRSVDRFELLYVLVSLRFNFRIIIRVRTSQFKPVPSTTFLFQSSGWLEREVWDLFGVYFINHPDLRRILTDYGFKGHPLRKDFSLNGYYEVRYDELFKTVSSEPVELSQEFRLFDFKSPWENSL